MDPTRADLVVDGLSMEYDSAGYLVRPVHELSFSASDGHLVVLHGPSGCGKTTLLSVLAGLLSPVAGTVTFAGEKVTGLSGADLIRHRRHALVLRGDPSGLPAELAAMTPTQGRDDLRRPLSAATGTLGILSVLLWLVAAGIVGVMSYLSGLDRIRDFAVFKAVGVNTGRLVVSMVLQTLFVAILAALLAGVWTLLIVPVFPLAITISAAACLQLLGVATLIGLVASGARVRQAVRVDPALAFSNG